MTDGATAGRELARLLREFRRAAGLTQQDLATRAGLSAAAIRDLEQCRTRQPRPDSIDALAGALRLGPAEVALLRAAARRASVHRIVPPAAAGTREIRALGPLTVHLRTGHLGAGELDLGGPGPRTLLGRLALTPGTPVARAELIELLWPGEVPDSAVNLVQTYVSRLRRVLEPHRPPRAAAGVVNLAPGGYRLVVGPDQLDVVRFRQLTAEAREQAADRPAAAGELLDRALAGWRDDPVSDVEGLREHPAAVALIEEWIAAALLRADLAHADLAHPDLAHEAALRALRILADRHPLHEAVAGRLMLALAATGRQADALDAYDAVRRRLAEQLGIDPGPGLADARLRVLRGGTAAVISPVDNRPTPFQVPAAPGDFTGRETELRDVLAATVAGVVHAIAGVAGVGKTALVRTLADRLRADFPDGQLHVDLLGAGNRPLRPAEALGRLLRALGLDPDPRDDEAELAGLYRSALAERRVLIVLDNARDAGQVRPLLPGPGRCATLVTSRRRLPHLEGARLLDLDLLPAADALDLLAAVAGPERVAADPLAAEALVAACGRLPLAIRIAGARLAGRPGWDLRAFLDRLGDQRRRLDELSIGDLDVRATFQLSLADLAAPLARAFRLLALAPGADFGPEAAAAVLDTDPATAERQVGELLDANLLEQAGPDRFRFHDLIRLFAHQQAVADEPATVRTAAVRRLLEWYQDRAAAGVEALGPTVVRLPQRRPLPAAPVTADDAKRWLALEMPNLVAAVEHAAEHGPGELAWELADLLRGYFFNQRTAPPWLATAEAGLAAAQAAGNAMAEAAMHQTLAQALWSIGDLREARTHYRLGLQRAEQSGWLPGVGYQLHNLGLVEVALGETAAARDHYLRSLEVCERLGLDAVRAVTLNDLGMMCWEQGALDEAIAYLADAMDLNGRRGHPNGEAVNRTNISIVLRDQGLFDAARQHLEAAEEHWTKNGSKYGELAALDERGQWHVWTGNAEEGIHLARRTLDLAGTVKDRTYQAGASASLGEALLAAGDASAAVRHLRYAYDTARDIGAAHLHIRAQAGLAAAEAAAGSVAAAQQNAAAALEAARAAGYRVLEIDALLALAAARLTAGQPTAAAEAATEALTLAGAIEAPPRADRAAALVAAARRMRPGPRSLAAAES
ncbi:BTAD domain-containing putative transcriptional regulator [Paractinoplanes rishiriensis]|uniref:SARP family transcriptional regulator n=1 Tax=Paractinoplanes rishiriensis TaxID=1050105 RepID=A0A919JY69_9ACTN|nr:BTAD domain-containing putative transcriptional regulator [Actinoplanes rishiriensis]GIE93131.1 SARP family transcriptional regulator [Actinoplanes rishiriensis]